MTTPTGQHHPASLGDDPTVLYFHHVGRPFDHYTSISADEFKAALDAVAEFGAILDPATAAGNPGFVITFDDGYAETMEAALPILEERGHRCILFLNTATIGGSVAASAAPRPMPATTWAEVGAAHTLGHQIGSHGHQHLDWSQLSASTVRDEVHRSIDAVIGAIAQRPFAFAYPYGRRPAELPAILEEYDCYGTTREAAAHHRCRPQAIRRCYLPARDRAEWRRLLAGWQRQRTARCDRCDCNAGPLV